MKKFGELPAQQRANEILRELQDKRVVRAAEVIAVDIEARTVELAFSSEFEVARWFGIEVLSHDEGACDLSRLNDGGAVLDGHDWSKHIGVVERAWIDTGDRKGRALVRYSRNPEGEAMLQDIADNIKRHVSVGYIVQEIKLVEEREHVDVYRVTRWQPYEISNVPIPADTSVGVGRSAEIPAMDDLRERSETAPADTPARAEHTTKDDTRNMNIKNVRNAAGDLVRAEVDDDGNIVRELEVIERAGDGERHSRAAGLNDERNRVRDIGELAARFGGNIEGVAELERKAIADGDSPAKFQRALMEKMDERANKPLGEQARSHDIGLSESELRKFSLLNVVRALVDPSNRAAQKAAGFEFEASEAARASQQKDTGNFVIPTDVLRHAVFAPSLVRAPLAVGAPSTGANLVATSLQSQSFIDVLRNSTTILRRARILAGLIGNIDIPKKLTASSGYWLSTEDEDAAETGMTLGQIPMSPKTVAGYSEITRKMLQQSSLDIEALLRADIAEGMGLAIDAAGYYGTGADGQPLGIANVVGINAVEFVGANPTFGELVDMETALGSDNAIVDSLSYIGNAKFRGHCKKTEAFANTGRTLWERGGTVNGYSTEITNQVSDGDVFLNNFGDMLVGMWGGLEINVDPFSNSKKGRIRIVTFQDVDFAHRRVESFCLGRQAVAP